jgi:hypothetical protein
VHSLRMVPIQRSAIAFARAAHDMDDPGGVFDEEQHIDPLEKHRTDMEQVAGEDALGLGLHAMSTDIVRLRRNQSQTVV